MLIKYNIVIIPQKSQDDLKKEITKIHKRMVLDILKNKEITINTNYKL